MTKCFSQQRNQAGICYSPQQISEATTCSLEGNSRGVSCEKQIHKSKPRHSLGDVCQVLFRHQRTQCPASDRGDRCQRLYLKQESQTIAWKEAKRQGIQEAPLLNMRGIVWKRKVSSFNSSHVRSQQVVISFDSQSLLSQPLCPLLTASLDTASASGR